MTAWQAKASAPAAKIGWSPKAAASSWALIFRAIPSRILSSALRAWSVVRYLKSPGELLSIALVSACRVKAPNSPTLELSCL